MAGGYSDGLAGRLPHSEVRYPKEDYAASTELKNYIISVVKSDMVDAPVITEFPMALECGLVKQNEDGNIIGEIVNVSADEDILDENGLIDVEKLQPISLDPVHNDYLKWERNSGSTDRKM